MPLDKINMAFDALFHYRRMISLSKALETSSFPVYLDYDAYNGYGYGTKWFYSDFLLIPFAWISKYIGLANSYKIMYFILTILCGIFSYKTVRIAYKSKLAATITALSYTFCAFRLQGIYERFALGEAFSYTFIPIIFIGLYYIIKGNYKKWYILSIGFSLLIFSHIISSIIIFSAVIVVSIIYYKDYLNKPQRIIYLILAGVTTIIITSYFILPFFEQFYYGYFHVNQPNSRTFAQHNRSSVAQVIYSLFTIGYPKLEREFVPCIGITITLLILLRFFIKDKLFSNKSIELCLLGGVLLIVLSLNFIPWSIYPLKAYNFIQFPWRFFGLACFIISIAGGYYCSLLWKNNIRSYLAFITFIGIIAGSIFIGSNGYKEKFDYNNFSIPEATYSNRFFLINMEYLSYSLPVDSIGYMERKKDKIYTKNADTEISNIMRTDGSISCNVKITENDTLEYPFFYYKGYHALSATGNSLPIIESSHGMIAVPIEKSDNITVSFSGTFLQKNSIYITLVSIILLCIYIVVQNRKFRIC